MIWFDPTYVLVIIGVIICLMASANVNSTSFANNDSQREKTIADPNAIQCLNFGNENNKTYVIANKINAITKVDIKKTSFYHTFVNRYYWRSKD